MSEKGSETKFKITKKGVSKITNEGKHNDKPKTQFEFKILDLALICKAETLYPPLFYVSEL